MSETKEICIYCGWPRHHIFHDKVIELPPYKDDRESDGYISHFIHRQCVYHAVWAANRFKEIKKLWNE